MAKKKINEDTFYFDDYELIYFFFGK